MLRALRGTLSIFLFSFGAASLWAQAPAGVQANAPPEPVPLPTPAITGPLQAALPAVFDAGSFGNISVNGILTGIGLWQGNHIPGDHTTPAALSNGQIFIQKTAGWFQFYLQAGKYTFPSLGARFLSINNTSTGLFGPLPVAYLKLAPAKNTSILSQTGYLTSATPVQNNRSIYNVIYTYTKGSWILQPYFQHTDVPTNQQIGIVKGASTNGGAVLVSHTFKHGFSLAGRAEYITSSGSVAGQAVNLLYGPGSGGWSATVTPTFQEGGFFVRSDLSFVRATSYTPGYAFWSNRHESKSAESDRRNWLHVR